MSTPTNPPPLAKPANGQARAEVDSLREKLAQLGPAHAAEALGEELSEAVKHNRPAHLVLDRLLSRETGARDERRVKVSLKRSNLPSRMTLGNFLPRLPALRAIASAASSPPCSWSSTSPAPPASDPSAAFCN
jgi:hypothetical protein